jgi:cytidylate kinase
MELPESKSINLAVSGWPGSGSTSFALILATILKRKYFYIGDIFRYLGTSLGHSVTGKSQAEFDGYIEDIIGKTVDNYVDHKLLNENNMLLESDITAFRIGRNPKIFSIFIKATYEERLRRVHVDGREDGEKYLKSRDDILQQKYKELWDVDFFSEETIAKKYNLVIDNTIMTLENELKMSILALNEYHKFSGTLDLEKFNQKIDTEVAKFWKEGKKSFKERLAKKGLYMKPEEILAEITQEFPEDVIKFPPEVQAIFLGKK